MKYVLWVCFAVALNGEDKESAKRLLDSAYEMISAAQPQVQAMSLLHTGHHYRKLDPVKSAEYLRQAFAATAPLSEDSNTGIRSQLQAEIVKLTAKVNLDLAIEQLKQLTPPANSTDAQNAAYVAIAGQLTAKKEFDRAMEVLASASAQTDYPFDAASNLLAELPADDPRRIIVFGNATTAYVNHPASGFARMVGRHWQKAPKEMVERGLDAILNHLSNKKTDSVSFSIAASKDGTAKMQANEVREFALIVTALEKISPARAKEWKSKHKELADVDPVAPPAENAEKDKEPDSEDHGLMPVSFVANMLQERDMAKAYSDWKKSSDTAADALNKMKQDPSAALAKARQIRDTGMRAEVMARIAASIGKKDIERARTTIGRAMELLKELKNPSERLMARVALGEAALAIEDEGQAVAAFGEAFRDAEALFQLETANLAIMEQWVSVGSIRVAASTAAKKMGPKAETLLGGIQNADLALLARIEMAAALLGEGPTVSSMNVRFSQ